MALKNSDNHYFKIGSISIVNDGGYSLAAYVEGYKSQSVRDSRSEYDNVVSKSIRIELDAADVNAFVTKIYEKIKLQEPYSEMTDVLES